MTRYKLLRAVTLAALNLSVVSMPVSASIVWQWGDQLMAPGTYNNSNGHYWVMYDSGIVNDSDRTLTAGADVTFHQLMQDSIDSTQAHLTSGYLTIRALSHKLNIDMKDYNLSFVDRGFGSYLWPNAIVNIYDAKNFYNEVMWARHVYAQEDSEFKRQANNDITLKTLAEDSTRNNLAVKNGGGMVSLKGSKVTINAGHDFIVDDSSLTTDNSYSPAFINSVGSQVSVSAGHDISVKTTKPSAVYSRTGNSITSEVTLNADNAVNLETTNTAPGWGTLRTGSGSKIAINAKDLNIKTESEAIRPGNSGTDASTASNVDINLTGHADIERGSTGTSENAVIYANKYNQINIDAKSMTLSTGKGPLIGARGHGNINIHTADNMEMTRQTLGTKENMVYADSSGELTLTSDNGTITLIDRGHGRGIYSNDTTIQVNGNLAVDETSTALMTENNGKIHLSKGLVIHPNMPSDMAIHADSGKVIGISAAGDKKVTGEIYAENNGQVELNFGTSDSYFRGWTEEVHSDTTSASADYGTISLVFAPGALWDMTDDSMVSHVTNNGIIDLSGARASGGHGKYLTVENFSGNGAVKMYLDWESNQGAKHVTENSDYINIDNGSGIQTVYVEPSTMNLNSMTDTDRLYFSTVNSGNMQFVNGFSAYITRPGHLYDTELYINHENHGTVNDWYYGLRDWKTPDHESPVIPSVQKVDSAVFSLATNMDRLNKRLGEARYLSDTKEGIWTREYYTRIGMDGFRSHSTHMEIGYNHPEARKDSSVVHEGGSFEYATGNMSHDYGDAKLHRYDVEGYHTWLGKDGHYLDLVGRIGRITADADILLRGGNSTSADYGTWFESASVEYGRRTKGEDGWFIEPQTQLQYTHLNSASYSTKDGISVDKDNVDSLIGRLGIRLGRNMSEKAGWYVKADMFHEFFGDKDYGFTAINGMTTLNKDATGKRTWGDLGFGFQMVFSHGRSLWLDAERYIGNGIHNAWQLETGASWKF